MKTAVKKFKSYMRKIGALFSLSLAVLFAVIIAASMTASDSGEGFMIAMIVVLGFLVIMVFAIFELVTLIVASGFKNSIKKQEEINGDSLQEEWDQDVTDLGKGYYLTKDWIVSTHSPAMAFHKNTIDDYTVEKDFVRGKEVHIYTLRGNGASIQMRFTENGSGENLSSVNKWFKRRREELNALKAEADPSSLEGETETMSETVEEERIPITNRPQRDPNSAKKVLAIIGFIGALLVLLLITSFVSGKVNSKKEINKVIKQSEYDTIDEYADYLKEVAGSNENIEFYLDEYSDGYHVVTIENNENSFYYCELLLDSSDSDSEILVFARPRRNEYYYREFTDVPDTYEIKNDSFYEFTYPNVDFKYTIEDDGDSEGYIWENLVVAPEHLNLDDISKLAERLYAECVLTDVWYEVYYVFDENVEKVEVDGYYYYDLSTAQYGFAIDLENKQIVFYELIGESFEECMTIEMK